MAEENAKISVPQISIPLKIPNISKLTEVDSEVIMVHGIPWQINVVKKTVSGKQWLSVYLHCAIEDKSPHWSYAAYPTFKLVPFSGNGNVIEKHTGWYVFECTSLNIGFPYFIEWKELFKAKNDYVKDDTIILKVKIVVADPKEENSSKMLFETIEKCCNGNCLSKYRLTVTNIDKLIVVKSPRFKIQNSPWVIMISRGSSDLAVMLDSKECPDGFSCKVHMSVKLLSLKDDIEPIEETAEANTFTKYDTLGIDEIVSWDELVKPENGFVSNNSIVIEVEIKAYKQNGAVHNDQSAPKRLKLECSICLEAFGTQEVSSTKCGHLFCSPCLKNWVEVRGKCPTCNKKVELDSWFRIYLQSSN